MEAVENSRSTITGTQGCLAAPETGETLSSPALFHWPESIWLLVAPGISPRVESRVSDEDSIGEKNKWRMREGGYDGCLGNIFWARAEEERGT